jgi:hypothetical protein
MPGLPCQAEQQAGLESADDFGLSGQQQPAPDPEQFPVLNGKNHHTEHHGNEQSRRGKSPGKT